MKQGLFMVFLIVLSSCAYKYTRGFIKRELNVSNLINPKTANSKFQTHGFYYTEEHIKRAVGETEKVDTFFAKMIFYPDGHFIYNLSVNQGIGTLSQNIEETANVLSYIESDSILYNQLSYGNWGYYRLNSDTVKAKFVIRPAEGKWNTVWRGFELEYLLLNDSTLKRLSSRPIHKMSQFNKQLLQRAEEKKGVQTAHFKYVENLPEPNPWFMSEPWYHDY